ncbi:SBBP repeat-containing protein [Metabacillus arenae]|uniref:SBBP repeat-containing protein n=1 Tax=Metabacillus arenae TaxID=2771434 RepID=A0A926NT36_9BACI|nr:SBBP repeat-containing protein [Metabacillus arenae]MBD1383442.1 SBBP repeat-containing protein [Metabacillus arenae]
MVSYTNTKMPIYFVPNQGQLEHEHLLYYCKARGCNVFFTNEGASFVFLENEPQEQASIAEEMIETTPKERKGFRLDFRFLNGGHKISPIARGELEGKVNYFRGPNPNKWHTNISTFMEVVYQEVWPGIDLVFRGEQDQIKYDFFVNPGANVDDICFTYRGAEDLSLDEEGNLLIDTLIGEIKDKRPISYQVKDGKKVDVESAFHLCQDEDGEDVLQFSITDYVDVCYPLIIDPELIYSSYLGGTGDDFGSSIAVDEMGNAYVTGFTHSPDFPTVNAFQPAFGGVRDAYVTKVDPSGGLIYSSYLGGTNSDQGSSIVVDEMGNAYVTGFTHSPDFPIVNAFQPVFGGGQDAFVTKVDPSGGLIYSSYLGGTGDDFGSSIAVDGMGNAYVTGRTSSLDFPTVNPFQPVFGGGQDAYVTKVDPSGGLIYSSYLGGINTDDGRSIAVDGMGNAYLTGITLSPDFPTVNAFQPAFGGGFDAYVTKVDPSGGLIYSSYLGGTGNDLSNSIAVDEIGNAYVTGFTLSLDFPTVNAFQPAFGGGFDAYVTKVDPSGGLIYSSYLGGTNIDQGSSIAVDEMGNAYVTGFTHSPDFPTVNAFQPAFGGVRDAYVTKVDPSGGLIYSSYLGGINSDQGSSIVVDEMGNAYVTGFTHSPDFPTVNAFQPVFGGGQDVYVTKVDPSGGLIYSSYLGGTGDDIGSSIVVDEIGNAYVTGSTNSPDFPTVNAFQPTFGGGVDAFVTKIGLQCPDDITVDNDPGQCGAIVTYNSPPGATCDPPSGSFFPVGDTIVTCTEDNQECAFQITVNDTEPPQITCSDDITVAVSTGEGGTIVTYSPPTVSDNCPGVTFLCSPASGSFFPVGMTTVTCTATDASGNTSSCSFTVTVQEAKPPVLTEPTCIRTKKVYDWIFFSSRYFNKSIIPDEDCRATVATALAEGLAVTVTCTEPLSDAVTCKPTILENGNPGKMLVTWTVPINLTVSVDEEEQCIFTVRTQFQDEVMVCIPEGITEENILCRATQVICRTNGPLMGSDPFGPMIPLTVTLCKELQVEYPVKLEVLGKFCFPRPNNIPAPPEEK